MKLKLKILYFILVTLYALLLLMKMSTLKHCVHNLKKIGLIFALTVIKVCFKIRMF